MTQPLPDQLPAMDGQRDLIAQAARDATAAADNSQQLQLIAAVLQAQQLVNAQPQACQHAVPKEEFNAKKWLTIGGLAAVGGCVACFLAMAFAVAATAVAIGGVCATGCLLVLRSMWRQYMSEKH